MTTLTAGRHPGSLLKELDLGSVDFRPDRWDPRSRPAAGSSPRPGTRPPSAPWPTRRHCSWPPPGPPSPRQRRPTGVLTRESAAAEGPIALALEDQELEVDHAGHVGGYRGTQGRGAVGVPGPVVAQQPALALGRRGCGAAPVRSITAGFCPSADQSGRDAHIGCGAVLDHLRVAMAAAGWTANVDRFPNPNNLEHLASLDFSPISLVTDGHRRRADAILHRRTDRLPFAAPRNWQSFEPVLRHAVDAGTVHLDVIADELRPELARASHLTESLRLYDSSYHTELDWWTGHFENSDEISRSSLASAGESDRVDIGRTFPVGAHHERRASIEQDPSTVLVLSTDEDTRDDALRCGEALSAVLLECTLAGMATCTLTELTELWSSRNLISTLTGRTAMPQVLIRVGEAPVLGEVPPMTPRRPLRDVLTFHRDTSG